MQVYLLKYNDNRSLCLFNVKHGSVKLNTKLIFVCKLKKDSELTLKMTSDTGKSFTAHTRNSHGTLMCYCTLVIFLKFVLPKIHCKPIKYK